MERISKIHLAERSGVEAGFVEQLVELGIVEPDVNGKVSQGDVRRVRIMEAMDEAGLPLEGLSEAVRTGLISLDFIDSPSYERWASLTEVSFQDLSEETGIPTELLTVVREAMGFAKPAPSDMVREDEMAVVPLIRIQYEFGIGPSVIERALRVYGESMRRVAETESDWWAREIVMPIINAGKPPAELAEVSKTLSPVLAEASDRAVLAIFHGQQTNSWLRNLLEGFEFTLESAGLYSRPERVPAMCFLDLTGYTRLTEEQGDVAAADLATDLSNLVQQISKRHGGTAVKWLGDGVMFHFPQPGSGVLAGLDMVDEAADLGLPPAHVGLHAGPVLFQEGDYFGRTVNIAARIADYARPGEVVVSQEVVSSTGDEPITFIEIGPVELKGVSDVVQLFRAYGAQGS